MKAPMLLGNDIPKIDNETLSVLLNKDAISVSQDSLGVQAQRVWTGSAHTKARLNPEASVYAVTKPCAPSQPTQTWHHRGGVLSTMDAAGVEWCVHDAEGTEDVGSWRAAPCTLVVRGTSFQQTTAATGVEDASGTAFVTPAGRYLTPNNAMGASGPVPHSRHLAADQELTVESSWMRVPVSGGSVGAFRLKSANRRMRNDNKIGGVTMGGDFCLDIAQDGDSEVWAGPLANKSWAVALLNRDSNATANITVDYTMFNATAGASFAVRDIWAGQDTGTHTGSITAMVKPQAVTYMILTPA